MPERVTIEGTRHTSTVLQASYNQVLWQLVDEDTPRRRPDLWYRRVTYTFVKLDTGASVLERSETEEPWKPEE